MAEQSITITVQTELDVLSKYTELISEAMSGDSSYIRAKETLEEMYKGTDVTFCRIGY